LSVSRQDSVANGGDGETLDAVQVTCGRGDDGQCRVGRLERHRSNGGVRFSDSRKGLAAMDATRVVVGVDGSIAAQTAVCWAPAEAARRSATGPDVRFLAVGRVGLEPTTQGL
jgi:hypothetical protein